MYLSYKKIGTTHWRASKDKTSKSVHVGYLCAERGALGDGEGERLPGELLTDLLHVTVRQLLIPVPTRVVWEPRQGLFSGGLPILKS